MKNLHRFKTRIAVGGATVQSFMPLFSSSGLKVDVRPFVARFNTESVEKYGTLKLLSGTPALISVVIFVDKNRNIAMEIRGPSTVELLRAESGIARNRKKVKENESTDERKARLLVEKEIKGSITKAQLKRIAEYKLSTSNTSDIDKVMKSIEATAIKMQIEIKT